MHEGTKMAKVLVIEDEPELGSLIKQTLEDAGLDVRHAANGIEGIKEFRQEPCEVVITDILMPEKDGLETIMELRALNPKVKIIAISGGGRLSQGALLLSHAQAFGADYAVQKPLVLRDMLNLVLKLIPPDGLPEADTRA